MSFKSRLPLALAAGIVALSVGCFAKNEATYGYLGEGDPEVVGLLRKIHMGPSKGIEEYLRKELYRGKDPAELLTAEYLKKRGATCVELPAPKCSFKGEAILFFSDHGIYTRTGLDADFYLMERPQRLVVTKTEFHSKTPIHSIFRPR